MATLNPREGPPSVRFALMMLALLPAAPTHAQEWSVDGARTQIHWEARHFDTSTSRGRFDRFETQLVFDPVARRGELAVTVDTRSITSGIAPFDSVLRGSFMFDTVNHPTAWFVSRDFVFDGDRLAAIRGELTLRGQSRPLTLKALAFGCRDERCGGDFEGDLKRSDFGITYGQPFGADRVRLFVSVQALRR